jgi:phosphoribosylformylglycinamidine synthase
MKPRILILRTAGTNCDIETACAFELAGGLSTPLHVNRLLENPQLLSDFEILAIPGGFSYGDDIAAGKIFANQIVNHLGEAFHKFIAEKKPIIGICNGFQVLVKTDLLPGPIAGAAGQAVTLTNNACGRFIDRWVQLEAPVSKCIWTEGLDSLDLPVAHGEGRFLPASEDVRQALWASAQVALIYSPNPSDPAMGNPNGSVDDIAGICDETGLILGLMPHPERFVRPDQHPARDASLPKGLGLRFFKNAIDHVSCGVGRGL